MMDIKRLPVGSPLEKADVLENLGSSKRENKKLAFKKGKDVPYPSPSPISSSENLLSRDLERLSLSESYETNSQLPLRKNSSDLRSTPIPEYNAKGGRKKSGKNRYNDDSNDVEEYDSSLLENGGKKKSSSRDRSHAASLTQTSSINSLTSLSLTDERNFNKPRRDRRSSEDLKNVNRTRKNSESDTDTEQKSRSNRNAKTRRSNNADELIFPMDDEDQTPPPSKHHHRQQMNTSPVCESASRKHRNKSITPPPPINLNDYAKRQVGEKWFGRIEYENGSLYTGELTKKDNGAIIREGSGTMLDKAKQKVYEGSFENDLKHGQGSTRYLDKFHKGEYVRGLRNGFGCFIFSSGDTYEGQFEKGELHGKGRMVFNNGLVFEGEFVRGIISAGIKKNLQTKESCEGTFDKDYNLHGFGTAKHANGDYHRGFFQHGVPHGKGDRFNREQGTNTLATFVNGRIEDRFMVTRGSRYVYVGELKGEVQEGMEKFLDTGSTANLIFARLDGDEQAFDDDEMKIVTRLGMFKKDKTVFPPKLVSGTYTSERSRVTCNNFLGSLVIDKVACFHDVQTGNVRWTHIGAGGPIGNALYVYANGQGARMERYEEEGNLASFKWV